MPRNPLLDPEPIPAWMNGPGISKEDLQNGSSVVQRVTAEEWWKGASDHSGQRTQRYGKPAARPPVKPGVIAFGKYRGRLIVDVMEEDPGYIEWAIRDVDGFAAKVEAVS